MNRWFALQFQRNRHVSAAGAIVCLGYEAFIPLIQRRRILGGRIVEGPEPRFGIYLFARFDRDVAGWQSMLHAPAKRAGIVNILMNAEQRPSPVPDEAIEAMRAYQPLPAISIEPYRYQPGEPVKITKGGFTMHGVFVDYCGNRPFVRTWIFGAERVTEVSGDELEPQNLDNQPAATTTCAR